MHLLEINQLFIYWVFSTSKWDKRFACRWRKNAMFAGVAPGKAAVLQICGDNSCCHVLHIIHSGIPEKLRSLLEDNTSLKVVHCIIKYRKHYLKVWLYLLFSYGLRQSLSSDQLNRLLHTCIGGCVHWQWCSQDFERLWCINQHFARSFW